MYDLVITNQFRAQFKTLEKRVRTGSLSSKNMKSLVKYQRCFFKLINNPWEQSLNSSSYEPLRKYVRKVSKRPLECYHSYIENNSRSQSARRIYWYFGSDGLTILGIANHPINKHAVPKFKDLANEAADTF